MITGAICTKCTTKKKEVLTVFNGSECVCPKCGYKYQPDHGATLSSDSPEADVAEFDTIPHGSNIRLAFSCEIGLKHKVLTIKNPNSEEVAHVNLAEIWG